MEKHLAGARAIEHGVVPQPWQLELQAPPIHQRSSGSTHSNSHQTHPPIRPPCYAPVTHPAIDPHFLLTPPPCHPTPAPLPPGGHATQPVMRAVRWYLQHEWERKRLEGVAAAAAAAAVARQGAAVNAGGGGAAGGVVVKAEGACKEEVVIDGEDEGANDSNGKSSGGGAGSGAGGSTVPYRWSLEHPEMGPVQLTPAVLPQKRLDTLPQQVGCSHCWFSRPHLLWSTLSVAYLTLHHDVSCSAHHQLFASTRKCHLTHAIVGRMPCTCTRPNSETSPLKPIRLHLLLPLRLASTSTLQDNYCDCGLFLLSYLDFFTHAAPSAGLEARLMLPETKLKGRAYREAASEEGGGAR